MGIRKNPDWSVWAGDVVHWATRPPGIYFCLLAGAAIVFYVSCYTALQPKPVANVAYAPPSPAQYVQQIPFRQIQPSAPISTSRADGSLSCVPGTTYDLKVNRCMIWEPGTQNNCRDDFIFIDRLYGCVYLGEATRYIVYPGNFFRVSGQRPTRVTVVAGSVAVWDRANRLTYVYPRGTVTTRNWMAVQASRSTGARLFLTMD